MEACNASAAGTLTLGGDLTVNHALEASAPCASPARESGGEPKDAAEAVRVHLRRAVELGVNFIDTADAYGPQVSERLIAEAVASIPRRTRDCDQSGPRAPRSRSMGGELPSAASA